MAEEQNPHQPDDQPSNQGAGAPTPGDDFESIVQGIEVSDETLKLHNSAWGPALDDPVPLPKPGRSAPVSSLFPRQGQPIAEKPVSDPREADSGDQLTNFAPTQEELERLKKNTIFISAKKVVSERDPLAKFGMPENPAGRITRAMSILDNALDLGYSPEEVKVMRRALDPYVLQAAQKILHEKGVTAPSVMRRVEVAGRIIDNFASTPERRDAMRQHLSLPQSQEGKIDTNY